MFSGIVEETGKVLSYDGQTMVVSARAVLEDLKVSESINVSGACLTIVKRDKGTFTVQTVPETVKRTNFRNLKAGMGVNLERSLTFGARIGGHMVQGHVDATGTVTRVEPDGNSVRVGFKAPANIIRCVVEKGFIAVDGVSLTVVDRTSAGFSVAIIPYTRGHTTFGERKPGDLVNLEADVMAKYVEALAAPYLRRKSPLPAGHGVGEGESCTR
jgi:riboflavin synthase